MKAAADARSKALGSLSRVGKPLSVRAAGVAKPPPLIANKPAPNGHQQLKQAATDKATALPKTPGNVVARTPASRIPVAPAATPAPTEVVGKPGAQVTTTGSSALVKVDPKSTQMNTRTETDKNAIATDQPNARASLLPVPIPALKQETEASCNKSTSVLAAGKADKPLEASASPQIKIEVPEDELPAPSAAITPTGTKVEESAVDDSPKSGVEAESKESPAATPACIIVCEKMTTPPKPTVQETYHEKVPEATTDVQSDQVAAGTARDAAPVSSGAIECNNAEPEEEGGVVDIDHPRAVESTDGSDRQAADVTAAQQGDEKNGSPEEEEAATKARS